MKRTLQPKPEPVELSFVATIFGPFGPSVTEKLSLQVGQAQAEEPPRASNPARISPCNFEE